MDFDEYDFGITYVARSHDLNRLAMVIWQQIG